MGFDPHEPEQSRRLREALKASDLGIGELWLNYFSLGGSVGEYEVEAYLQGLLSLPPTERDLLAMAGNELIDRVPRIHAPYSDDLDSDDLTAPTEENRGERDQTGLGGELSQPGKDQGTGEDEHGQEPPRT
ncbi:hypothetical protein [Arthrobacter sp. CDRTa11]|uniref:hypothetical protein n=1 Tax=Arthrobacter sp. CDRTa11 TaxID=2651199 RepID=UPI002265D6C3|nr:hypothetical protein [Arthrobacter sp. CDRTa11]